MKLAQILPAPRQNLFVNRPHKHTKGLKDKEKKCEHKYHVVS